MLFALALAYLLLTVVKSAFMGLWANQYLDFDLQENISVYFAFLGLAGLIGLLAGAYPALYLSRYSPTQALKNSNTERRENWSTESIECEPIGDLTILCHHFATGVSPVSALPGF